MDEAEKIYLRAQKAEHLGELEQAEDLYRHFAQLCPDDPRGPNKLGVIHALRGEMDKAERAFAQALALDAKFAPALTNSGNILLERGDVQGAVARYEEALHYEPNYPQAHNNLAAAMKRLGKVHPMVHHLKQAQRISRDIDRQRARSQVRGCAGRGTTVLLLAAIGALQIGVFWH